MPYDPLTRKQLLQIRRDERNRAQKENARDNLKKYSTGRNKGKAAETIRAARDLKNLAQSATPWGMWALIREMGFSDWPYFLALFAALGKDFFDSLALTGILYILVLILTFLISIFIGLMMILGASQDGMSNKQRVILRSWLTLTLTTGIEILPGVGLLPIETLSVLFIYGLALQARKQWREERKKQKSTAQTEEDGWDDKTAEAYA